MTDPVIQNLQRDFQNGTLPRNDYWKAIQQHHLLVDQYRHLIRGDLLDHIEIHAEHLLVVLKNGLRFIWDPTQTRQASSVLVNNGDYESDELYTLLDIAQGCKTILDVGANIGWYTLHLAQIVGERGGVVHAFEPIPNTYAELQRNLTLNPDAAAHIKTYPLALGETTQTVEFYIPAFQGSVAASRSALFPDDENIVVEGEMMPLDIFAERETITGVDLLKCDVEGAEIFVLRGGPKLIERDKPILMLEMLRKWAAKFDYHPDDMINLLAGYGYRCWYTGEDGRLNHLPKMHEGVMETNFFFLHDEKHADLIAAKSV